MPLPYSADDEAARAHGIAGRIPVLLDGGIRRGADALRALALGARAVFVGRPVLLLLQDGMTRALALLGWTGPGEVTRAHVRPAVSSFGRPL